MISSADINRSKFTSCGEVVILTTGNRSIFSLINGLCFETGNTACASQSALSPPPEETRANEWWVPKFGPPRFRLLVGLTYYPYTAMNAAYVAIGSLLSPSVHFERLGLLLLVYILAVGLGAHSLDALAPNKPWGRFLTRRQLTGLALAGLVPAIGLGLFLALSYSLLLLAIGAAELFLLLAYNLEWFGARFHTDVWFALSWGLLPVLAGYALQGGFPGPAALAAGTFGFSTAYLEISASRPYKAMKKDPSLGTPGLAAKFERVLKSVVASVVAAAVTLLAFRLG